MQQIYYTQEGKPYVLKSLYERQEVILAAPAFVSPIIFVNPPTVASGIIDRLNLVTDKPLVPVMCMYSATRLVLGVATVEMQWATPYYAVFDAGTTLNTINYYKSAMKNWPNVETIDISAASPTLFATYGIKYNQIVLTDADFLTPEYLWIYFAPDQSRALSNYINPVQLPAGTYRIGKTFLYFEAQINK